MAQSAQPGDVVVSEVTISGPNGAWNAGVNLLSGTVTESIFTPGVTADLEIIDYLNMEAKYDLKAAETVALSFSKPNGASASYTLHVNRIHDVLNAEALHSKIFRIEAISREALTGQLNQVQKNYSAPVSAIVSDILKNVVGTTLPIHVETTKGMRDIQVFNQRAYEALEMLRKEGISESNPAANFMLWITGSGFHFRTLDSMTQAGDAKTLRLDNTVGHSIFSDIDSSILAWEVEQVANAMNRAKAGMRVQVATFDSFTNQVFKNTNAGSILPLLGQEVITTLESIASSKSFRTMLRPVNPSKSARVSPSHVPDALPNKMMNLAAFTEQLLHLTVIGDPILEAGKTVNCLVPSVTSETGSIPLEPQLSGRWLLSMLQHDIRRADQAPRYVCHAEALKGCFAT